MAYLSARPEDIPAIYKLYLQIDEFAYSYRSVGFQELGLYTMLRNE